MHHSETVENVAPENLERLSWKQKTSVESNTWLEFKPYQRFIEFLDVDVGWTTAKSGVSCTAH